MPCPTKRILIAAFCSGRAVCTPPETQPTEPTFEHVTKTMIPAMSQAVNRLHDRSPATPQPSPEEIGWDQTLIHIMNKVVLDAGSYQTAPSDDAWFEVLTRLKATWTSKLIEEETSRMENEIEELKKSHQVKVKLDHDEKEKLLGEKNQLKIEKDELQKTFNDLDQKVRELTLDKNAATRERDELQDQCKKQVETLEGQKKANQNLTADIAGQKKDNQNLSAEVVNLNERVQTLGRELKSGIKQVNECKEENSKLRDELEQSKRWTLFG